MAKFTYLRGNFQKLLRAIERTPSGSGGKAPPKWEFFSACSFLRPVYATSQSEPSFVIPTESVFQGSQEDLEFMCTPLPQAEDSLPNLRRSPSPSPNPFTVEELSSQPVCSPTTSISSLSVSASVPSPSSSLSAPASVPPPSSSAPASVPSPSPSPSPRAKKPRKDNAFMQAQAQLCESVSTMQDVLKRKQMERIPNNEEILAMNTVKGVMAAIPDSHHHLRVEFNAKLLDLAAETYKRYYNDVRK